MHWSIYRPAVFAFAILVPVHAVAADISPSIANEIAALRELVPLSPQKSATRLSAILAELPDSARMLRVDALVELSNCEFWMGHKPAALSIGRQVEKIGRQYDDNAIIAKGLLVQSYSLSQSYDEMASQRLIQQAHDLAALTGDVPLKVQSLVSLGESNAENGAHAKGIHQIDAALALAKTSKDHRLIFMALKSRAGEQAVAGNYDAAFQDIDDMIQLAKADKNPAREARALRASYSAASHAGNAARALDALTKSLPLLEAFQADEAVADALINLSDLSLKLRRFPAALESSRRALELTQKIANRHGVEEAAFNYGIASIYAGNLEAGKRQIESALKTIGENTRPQDLTDYASALAYAGDANTALKFYRAAADLDYVGFRANKQMSVQALQKALEFEKKQIEIVQLKNENLQKATEIAQQNQRRWNLYAAIAFSTVLLAMSIIFMMRTRRQNWILASQQVRLMDANAALEWQSDHDLLTGLFNRRFFHKFMADGHSSKTGTVFLVDIDHFKKINDSFGHSAGDCVLKEVTCRLQVACQQQDIIVRWGGEEFLAYLPAASAADSAQFAAAILASVSATPISVGVEHVNVTVSIGYCPAPVLIDDADPGWEVTTNIADAALYFAKQNGRHRAYGIDECVNLSAAALAMLQTQFGAAIAAHAVAIRKIEGMPTNYCQKDQVA